MPALRMMTFGVRSWVRLTCAWLALVAGPFVAQAAGSLAPLSESIPSRGGKFFAEAIELPVPIFSQDDPRWSDDLLGPSRDTLGDMGCTITSVVMILNYYGIKTNPGLFNRYLENHDGYDGDGYLDFDRVIGFAPGAIRLAYQGACTYESLDQNLRAHHPIIVQLPLSNGGMHFVVVAGKRGYGYLVCDPAIYPTGPLVPLESVSPQIDHEFLYVRNIPAKDAPP